MMMMKMMTMMMTMSSLLIKFLVEVESDPWVKSCLMALRSRTMTAYPGT